MVDKFLNFLTYYYSARYFFLQKRKPAALAFRRLRSQFYVETWTNAASVLGLKTLVLDRKIIEIYSSDKKLIQIHDNYLSLDDSVTIEKTLNRRISQKLLNEFNIPIPRYRELEKFDFSIAKRFLDEAKGPVVVKPTMGTGGGSGITTNVDRMSRLIKAVAWARAFCPSVIIEDQIVGDTYRLLYLDGELLECIIRRPPTVVGDGGSTIRQLIRKENCLRISTGISRSQNLLILDDETRNTLHAQNLSLRSIPEAGQIVKVRTVINRNSANENESIKTNIAPSILEMGRTITKIFAIRYVGIDLITKDITRDLVEMQGVVLEVNAGPGLHYHYFKKDGPSPIAEIILGKLLVS
jgi:cyanophycin synthetase